MKRGGNVSLAGCGCVQLEKMMQARYGWSVRCEEGVPVLLPANSFSKAQYSSWLFLDRSLILRWRCERCAYSSVLIRSLSCRDLAGANLYVTWCSERPPLEVPLAIKRLIEGN